MKEQDVLHWIKIILLVKVSKKKKKNDDYMGLETEAVLSQTSSALWEQVS